MAEVTAHERSEIDKEACAWIAQFDGADPTAADLEAFREWVHRSPRHREAIERLSALWGELNVLTELAVPRPARRSRARRTLLAAAATAVLLLAVGLLWLPPDGHDAALLSAAYATAVGEQRTVELPDGSTVQLNTASRLEVAFSAQERELYLLAGEAFFGVTHEPGRPFLVHVDGRTVRAVGTAFSIRRTGDALEVLVTDGVVELSRESEPGAAQTAARQVLGTVERGQRVRLAPRDDRRDVQLAESVSEEELARELAWREGMLSFSGEPLALVIDEIGRYTRERIIIEDASLESLRIGGYFRAGDTQVMLETLEAGFPIEVRRMDDGTVRLRARQ